MQNYIQFWQQPRMNKKPIRVDVVVVPIALGFGSSNAVTARPAGAGEFGNRGQPF